MICLAWILLWRVCKFFMLRSIVVYRFSSWYWWPWSTKRVIKWRYIFSLSHTQLFPLFDWLICEIVTWCMMIKLFRKIQHARSSLVLDVYIQRYMECPMTFFFSGDTDVMFKLLDGGYTVGHNLNCITAFSLFKWKINL